MFLRLFPGRLKYQQTHLHREKFMVHRVCMIHAGGAYTPEMLGRLPLQCMEHRHQSPALISKAVRPSGPLGERGVAEMKRGAGERSISCLFFDLHRKRILVWQLWRFQLDPELSQQFQLLVQICPLPSNRLWPASMSYKHFFSIR